MLLTIFFCTGVGSGMIDIAILEIIGMVAMACHALGMLAAIHAVLTARTSQGAIAWALCLIFIPYLALPAYAASSNTVQTPRPRLKDVRFVKSIER